MKTLSLQQPWLNMILDGEKTIETRKWKTEYRGDLLLCSSKIPKIEPYGQALCVVNLIDCRKMRIEDERKAGCYVYDKAYSWIFNNLRKIHPFELKGKLMLFETDDSLIHFIK